MNFITNLDELQLSKSTVVYVYADEQQSLKDGKHSCAKYTLKSDGTKHHFYIKHRHGEVFDPYSMSAWKLGRKDWQYVKVNELAFGHYMKFLRTKSKTALHHAERQVNGT